MSSNCRLNFNTFIFLVKEQEILKNQCEYAVNAWCLYGCYKVPYATFERENCLGIISHHDNKLCMFSQQFLLLISLETWRRNAYRFPCNCNTKLHTLHLERDIIIALRVHKRHSLSYQLPGHIIVTQLTNTQKILKNQVEYFMKSAIS